MNRINITINSRVYTVVAEENPEYLKSLGDYINEKVNTVISEGTHVMGEKPLVLAALNICDEYFKLQEGQKPDEKISELVKEIKKTEKNADKLAQECERNAKEAKQAAAELDITRKMLDESEEKIKFLEGQIRLKESQISRQRTEFALREKELLDMMENR